MSHAGCQRDKCGLHKHHDHCGAAHTSLLGWQLTSSADTSRFKPRGAHARLSLCRLGTIRGPEQAEQASGHVPSCYFGSSGTRRTHCSIACVATHVESRNEFDVPFCIRVVIC